MHSKQTCSTQAKPDFDENCDSLLLSPLNIRSNRWYLIEQNLNLTCRIRSNSNSNFKRPYLGNETTNLISAGAKILLSSRAFTYSFMKVASRHSFTPFRAEKHLFRVFQRALEGTLWSEYAPGTTFYVGKQNLLHTQK